MFLFFLNNNYGLQRGSKFSHAFIIKGLILKYLKPRFTIFKS